MCKSAARAMGLQIQVLNASTNGEIDAAFATCARAGPTRSSSAPMRSSTAGGFSSSLWRRATRSPRSYALREYAEAGGLMSYGPSNLPMHIVRSASMPVASSRARSLPTCRCMQADQVRARHQPQDRQGSRPRRAADAARPRRRGDRMSAPGKAGAIQPVEVRPK